jgi:hypothetical protein
MKISRIFDQSTDFDELYEGYIRSQLDELNVGKKDTGYNKVTTITPGESEVVE